MGSYKSTKTIKGEFKNYKTNSITLHTLLTTSLFLSSSRSIQNMAVALVNRSAFFISDK